MFKYISFLGMPGGIFDIHERTVLSRTKYRVKVLGETLAFGFALTVLSEDVLCYWKKIAFSTLGLTYLLTP